VKGDENHHIWRVNADGTGTMDLTPGESMHRGEPVLPPHQPGVMLYSARRTTSPASMLYVQSLLGGEPRLVYTHPSPGGLADAAPDGSRALFIDFISEDNNILLEVDVRNGQTRRVYPPERKTATISSANYSADGRRIFVATDEGTEASVLIALDGRTGRKVARYVNTSPPTAQMTAVISPANDRIVIGVDAGNHGEVRILNAKTLALERDVKVPLGDVSVGAFRRDGHAFSILIALPDHPADIYSVDARTGQLTALRDDPRPGLASLPPIQASIQNVRAFDGLTIPINQYLPKRRNGKLPTMIIFHGGPPRVTRCAGASMLVSSSLWVTLSWNRTCEDRPASVAHTRWPTTAKSAPIG
jgi:dipeptidyl aminopeptidase/acylaminoacyl peptidase